MSVIGFNKLQVREIVEMGDGVYVAAMNGVDEAAYRELVQGMGMTFSSCEQKISFSVDPQNPDVMTEISTTVTLACKYNAYGLTYNGTLTLRSTIDLDLAEWTRFLKIDESAQIRKILITEKIMERPTHDVGLIFAEIVWNCMKKSEFNNKKYLSLLTNKRSCVIMQSQETKQQKRKEGGPNEQTKQQYDR